MTWQRFCGTWMRRAVPAAAVILGACAFEPVALGEPTRPTPGGEETVSGSTTLVEYRVDCSLNCTVSWVDTGGLRNERIRGAWNRRVRLGQGTVQEVVLQIHPGMVDYVNGATITMDGRRVAESSTRGVGEAVTLTSPLW